MKLRRLLYGLGGIVVMTVLVLLAGFAYLQTQSGKRFVAEKVSNLASTPPHQAIVLEGLDGFIPFELRLGRLTLSDAEGEWLILEQAKLQWSPFSLLRGRVDVREISAAKIEILRAPSTPEEEKPEEETSVPQLPSQLPFIVVEKISVPELILGEPLLGHGAVFSVDGSVTSRGGDSELTAALDVQRTDTGPATTMGVQVNLDPRSSQLGIRLALDEEPDGWLAKVAGLEDAGSLHAGIQGKGPLSDWNGTLRLDAGKYAGAHGTLRLQWTETIVAGLEGELTLAPDLLPHQWSTLVGEKTSFHFAIRSVPGVSVVVERATVVSSGLAAEGCGELSLPSQEVQGTLNIRLPTLGALEPLLEQPIDGSLYLEAQVAGTTGVPRGDVSLQVERLVFQEVSVERLQTHLTFSGKDVKEGAATAFDLSATGDAREIKSLTGTVFPENALAWTLAAHVPKTGEITLHQLKIGGERSSVEADGKIDPQTLAMEMIARLQFADLGDFQGLTGMEHSGRADLEVTLQAREDFQSARGTIDGRISDLKNLPENLVSLLGQQVKLRGEVDVGNKERVNVTGLTLEGGGFTVNARGNMNLADQSIEANLDLDVPDLQALSPMVQKPLTGSAAIKGRVSGMLDAMDVQVTLEGNRVVLDGEAFQKIQCELKGTDIPEKARGDFSLHVHKDSEKLSLLTAFLREGQRLHLNDLRLEGPGTSVRGDVIFSFEDSLADGDLAATFSDLSALGRFLGAQLQGTAQLDARLKQSAGKQDALIQLRGSRIGGDFGSLDSITLDAKVADILGKLELEADAALKSFTTPGLALESLTLSAKGDMQSIDFETNAGGEAQSPFDVLVRGAVSRTGEEDRVVLSALEGRYDAYPFSLESPMSLFKKGETLGFADLSLRLGDAMLEGAGLLDGKRVDVRVTLAALPLAMLADFDLPELSGEAHAALTLTGSPSRPRADMTLRLENVRSSNPDFEKVPPALVTAEAKLLQNKLESRLQLDGLFSEPAKVELALPVRFSLEPFDFQVSPANPLQGRLEAEADLHALMSLMPQEDHKVRGILTVNLDVGGTVQDPQLNGDVVMADGFYENWANGTVLDNLVLRVAANGPRIEIQEFRATDGQRGTLEVGGWMELDTDRSFPFEVAVRMADATLVRRDNVSAALSGSLNLAGSTRKASVGGELVVGPVEVDMGRRMAPSVTRLDVIEIHGSPKDEDSPETGEAIAPTAIDLDIAVRIPNRVFVRGAGLNSEWQGNLKVRGTATEPSIVGNLEIVPEHSNYLDFLDKRFHITRGVISFDGGYPPSPMIDITTETQGKDITGYLLVTGFADSPKIELASDPPVPQDEILSRILFGRTLSQITPMQAVKLAQAVRTLTSGGEPGIMDRTRSLLGLDQLEIREGMGEGASAGIGFGKYLREDIYIDVQRDLQGQAGRAMVEVEITPNITVHGEAGSDASTGLGINWKYDY